MPRIPRNPGSGKPPHNGPAGGHAARGAGWGGAARGNGGDRPAFGTFPEDVRKLGTETSAAAAHNPEIAAMLADRKRWDEEQERQAMAFYATKMRDDGEPTANRLIAADKLLDRIKGKPSQTVAQTTQNLGADGKPVDPPDTRRPIAELITEAQARAAAQRPH